MSLCCCWCCRGGDDDDTDDTSDSDSADGDLIVSVIGRDVQKKVIYEVTVLGCYLGPFKSYTCRLVSTS